jgi:predicted Fe-S protein YdhL (DUF1289 family)
MDETAGHCAGCFRTLDEIARWSAMDDNEKNRVLKALPARQARLAASLPRDIRD